LAAAGVPKLADTPIDKDPTMPAHPDTDPAGRPAGGFPGDHAGDPAVIREALADASREVSRVIVGQARTIERLWTCLLAGGHALLEGVPGVGKTALLNALASSVGGTFTRIQFTADLMPSDIVGTRIWRAADETFTTEPGPIFANFVLADEVNRAPAKVQSALLEVMAEQQVTIGGVTHRLPHPFLVLATQNPIDSEGTYPLPEAQRDRFMMRIMVGYPTGAEEWDIMARHAGDAPRAGRRISPDVIVAAQHAAQRLPIDEAVARYALDLVLATRDPDAYNVAGVADALAYGASPRASLALIRAGRAIALLRGQDHVTPQDIYDVAYDVLNHRLVLSYTALAAGVDAHSIVGDLLTTVKAPAAPTGRPFGTTGGGAYGEAGMTAGGGVAWPAPTGPAS
jgi:MoxR-like ATPase